MKEFVWKKIPFRIVKYNAYSKEFFIAKPKILSSNSSSWLAGRWERTEKKAKMETIRLCNMYGIKIIKDSILTSILGV